MKKVFSKRFVLTLVSVISILSLAACSALNSATSILASPELDTQVAVVATTAEVADAGDSVTTAPLVNTAISDLQSAGDLEADLIQVYQQANPGVVYIITPSGSGSGFVYDQDGHIVTNNHVVAGARSFEVVFASGERQPATLIGTDVDSDLAVIQVEQLPESAVPLPLGNEDDLQVGQFVVAIGNPFGEQGSMTLGIVSGLGRSLPSQRELSVGSTYSLPRVIQTDAAINPGNSGGPLLNLEGEVVGVNAAIASQTGTSSGVGFSIPVSAVRLIVPALIENGSYEYPYIGAAFDSEVSLEEQELYGLSQSLGAYVVNVTAGGPADQAGLVPANSTSGQGGDLIIALDSQPIQGFSDLNGYLVFHTTVGQTIEITLLRDGRQLTIPLTLGRRP